MDTRDMQNTLLIILIIILIIFKIKERKKRKKEEYNIMKNAYKDAIKELDEERKSN